MRRRLLLVVLLFGMHPVASASACPSTPINPITDVSWQCIFPIQIAGVIQLGGSSNDSPDDIDNPLCVCLDGALPRLGLRVSFWEPARMIDTTSDPWCMMALGTRLASPAPGTLGGQMAHDGAYDAKTFQQMHYYIFPVWAMLNLFTDIPCLETNGFDVAMMTEVVPTWNDDILSAIVNPEAVLFANPVAQLACAADSASALRDKPRNELFWCMGSWGSTYPLAGSITTTDYVEANAGLAARGIYFMGRTGLLRVPTEDGCAVTLSPIWRKDLYRLQMMKPVKDAGCRVIGKTGLLWSGNKHPPVGADNFTWMVFRKMNCCATW